MDRENALSPILRTFYNVASQPRNSAKCLPFPCFPFFAQVTLFAYSDVVCRRMFDVVPKHVQFILVKGLCNGFEDFMMQNAKTSDLKEWFAEDAQSERHRREMGRKLSQFQEAVKILKIARS